MKRYSTLILLVIAAFFITAPMAFLTYKTWQLSRMLKAVNDDLKAANDDLEKTTALTREGLTKLRADAETLDRLVDELIESQKAKP